jgi:hypothetical protein
MNTIEKKSESLFDGIKNTLNILKNALHIKKKPEIKEEISSKEQQEAGLVTEEILDHKNDILRHNEITNKINKEVVPSTQADLEKFKKSTILKKDIPAYVPKYTDTQQFVEQSDRISAPDIAQAADDLRNDVDRPFLS